MRAIALRWALLLGVVGVVVGAPAAYGALRDEFASPPAPLPGHTPVIAELTMTGNTTRLFRGSGRNDAILVVALSFGLSQHLDTQSGRPLGKTACSGVEFRKPTDAATPALVASLAANETITSARFRERGGLTITLTNAVLGSVRHVVAGTAGGYEDVTLIPHEVEVIWDATGHAAVHRCF